MRPERQELELRQPIERHLSSEAELAGVARHATRRNKVFWRTGTVWLQAKDPPAYHTHDVADLDPIRLAEGRDQRAEGLDHAKDTLVAGQTDDPVDPRPLDGGVDLHPFRIGERTEDELELARLLIHLEDTEGRRVDPSEVFP
jgi:hypothetical protein